MDTIYQAIAKLERGEASGEADGAEKLAPAAQAESDARSGVGGALVPIGPSLEQGAELITFDRGFGRYPGLRWRCLLDS